MGTDPKLRTTVEYKINGHFVHRDVWDVVEGFKKQVKELEYRVMIERRDKDLYAASCEIFVGLINGTHTANPESRIQTIRTNQTATTV